MTNFYITILLIKVRFTLVIDQLVNFKKANNKTYQ